MGKAYNSATGMIDCKSAIFTNGGGDSPTHWFECNLHKTITDPVKCDTCPDRKPRKAGCNTPAFRRSTPPPMPPICPKCGQPLKMEYGTGYCDGCRVIVDPLLLKKGDA